MAESKTADELEQAIAEVERAATNLSGQLKRFDLAGIPFCERDLNTVDLGAKIITAKKVLGILKAAEGLSK